MNWMDYIFFFFDKDGLYFEYAFPQIIPTSEYICLDYYQIVAELLLLPLPLLHISTRQFTRHHQPVEELEPMVSKLVAPHVLDSKILYFELY